MQWDAYMHRKWQPLEFWRGYWIPISITILALDICFWHTYLTIQNKTFLFLVSTQFPENASLKQQVIVPVYYRCAIKTFHIISQTVHHSRYTHSLCFFVVGCSLVLFYFTHIHQDCLSDDGAIMWLPPDQWINPEYYGSVTQINLFQTYNVTTIKQITTKPCISMA